VTDDMWHEAFGNRDKQMQAWIDVLADGVSAVGQGTHAGRRLETSQRFIEFLLKEMVTLMERWRESERNRSG